MNEPTRPHPAALVDVTCRHCHRRFGFAYPAPAGLPRCPGCGKQHELTKLEELMGQLDEFEEQSGLADAIALRISHGATLEQVAKTAGVGPATLRSFIVSASPLPAALYRQACTALGIEP